MFGDIFNQLGIKEDNMDRSLADKKFKRVTIECEDGTTYAGKIIIYVVVRIVGTNCV